MREIFLEIDGKIADLPANLKGIIRLMQAQNALADIDTRSGEYSYPLTLPLTRRNCAIFGQKQHAQTLDKFVKTDYSYSLRVGSEHFRGTFRLSNLKNGFGGNLLGEGYSWALALGERKLNELEFPLVEYDGSQLEQILSQGCDETDLQFPLLSFGNFFIPAGTRTNRNGEQEDAPVPAQAVIGYPLSVDDYYPGVYYRNVVRKIFESIGWHVQGSVLESPELREWVLTAAGSGAANAWPWGALLPASAARSTPEHYFSFYGRGPGGGYTNNAAAFDEERDVAFFVPQTTLTQPGGTRALSSRKAEYTAPQSGVYDFSAEVRISEAWQAVDRENSTKKPTPYFYKFAPVVAALVAFRGGEGYTGADGGLCSTGAFAPFQDRVLAHVRLDEPNGWSLRTGRFPLNAGGVYLETGDVVRLVFFARRRYSERGDGIDAYKREELHVTATSSFACSRFYGPMLMQPADVLPPITQKDFLKDLLVRTNTVPVADLERRVVTLMSRDEQRLAAGAALDLSPLVDPEAVEHVPTMGAGVGLLTFRPAQTEDPLLPAGADVVSVRVGSGAQEKSIGSLLAPVALRSYRLQLAQQQLAPIPTITTADVLKQDCSAVEWDISSLAPRVVRYLGPDPSLQIPFQLRSVPLARADWSGALRWDGDEGAVSRFYAGTLQQALRGHLSKFPAPLSPSLYRQLTPGREVWLHGAQYAAETSSGFDPADEAGQTSIELLRVV
ncbi:hypothetical protein [Hymenobacter fodinae]|uniref:Uncharacterized protein n=1 Tax=Hymenobacter fodinae TaxID=2510796 RepID=A0A4Z0P7V2_9BACT|nr:hypothetical protein [Hymenobacter fodinae]TGE08259.1 hypothetical protein EU556_11085 [Hymenobacter fodinae]